VHVLKHWVDVDLNLVMLFAAVARVRDMLSDRCTSVALLEEFQVLVGVLNFLLKLQLVAQVGVEEFLFDHFLFGFFLEHCFLV